MQHRNTLTQMTPAVGSMTGWFAVITQLYLFMVNRVVGITETLIRYFSFYTILTNILVAVCSTFSLLRPQSSLGRFFARSTTLTAIAVYITIVGFVYNLISAINLATAGFTATGGRAVALFHSDTISYLLAIV